MAARPTPPQGSTLGNFVSEWFGHTVWPTIDETPSAVSNQSQRLCPFISAATGKKAECVKRAKDWNEPYGVCTISSDSNGSREAWVVCPYRTLDQKFTLLADAVRRLYGVADSEEITLLPISVLSEEQQKVRLLSAARTPGQRAFLFSANKLGGEIQISETEYSPGAAVDISVIEVVASEGVGFESLIFGKHLFFEIQTSDFHGSPLHAASILKELCPQGASSKGFHERLAAQVEVCGTGVEGPNKANIFKRTIYQMLFKSEIAQHNDCVGLVVLIPLSVWRSWLRHLGDPELTSAGDDLSLRNLLIEESTKDEFGNQPNTYIYVFDVDSDSPDSPRALRIVTRVITNPASLMFYTFNQAAARALELGVVSQYQESFKKRVRAGWDNKLSSELKAKTKGVLEKSVSVEPRNGVRVTKSASGDVPT